MPLPRPSRLALLAVPVLAAAGAAAVTLGAGDGEQGAACQASRATAERIAPLARGEVAAVAVPKAPKPLPDIAFNGPDGRPMTGADLRGRTVLVNLWATWCAPCRHEMPALDRLQGELGARDFEVVAINVDTRNLEKPKAWLAQNGVRNLAFYADPSG